MRLSPEEMDLFEASCKDAGNEHAQELLNVFGAERALDVLNHMPTIPLGLLIDIISHLWNAMNHEMRRRGRGGFDPQLDET
jgi:hypothetical protein